jgi:hypothetical protein
MTKHSLALVSVFFLGLGLAACDEDQGEETTDENGSVDESEEQNDETDNEDPDDEELEEPADEDVDEPEGGDAGSRDNPLALGETFEGDEWTVTINDVEFDADDAVAAENEFNDPAPDGFSYALIDASVTYTGEDSEMVMMGTEIAFVANSGETLQAWDSIAIAPNELDSSAELYQGGSAEGNVAIALPDGDDGLIRVRTGFLDQQEAFFETE